MSLPALANICDSVTQTTKAQCKALVSLWHATDGANWKNSAENKWNKTNNPCQWEGVTCWGSNVVYLELFDNNLKGDIPDLSALSELRMLNLSKGELKSISDLSQHKKLVAIYFFDNQIMGNLPNITHLPNLKKLVVHNNPELFGPLTFNGNPNADNPVIHNTNLCRSEHIDYQQWNDTVSTLPKCTGSSVLPNLAAYNVKPNDGKDDSSGLNNLFEMMYFDSNPYHFSQNQITFDSGIYQFDQPVKISKLNNLTLKGSNTLSSPRSAELDLSKTNFTKSATFANNPQYALGSLLVMNEVKDSFVKDIIFHGKTTSSETLGYGDHGIALINTHNTTLSQNQIINIGSAAVALLSEAGSDFYSYNNKVENNQFDNICEVTTSGSLLGSEKLRFENNQVNGLKCSLRFHSPRHLAFSSLEINHNTISGPGSNSSLYSNAIEVTGHSNVNIQNNVIKDGPTYGIALRSHLNGYAGEKYNWGHINISNNEIDNYKKAIFIHNVNFQDGSFPVANNITLSNNRILSSWDSMNAAHIHFIGKNYSNSQVTGNEIYGGVYSIWPEAGQVEGIAVYNNTFYPNSQPN